MLDPEITKERKKREDQWMFKLRTIYQYDLINDSLNDQSSMKVVDTTGSTALLFSPFPRTLSRPQEFTITIIILPKIQIHFLQNFSIYLLIIEVMQLIFLEEDYGE